MPTQLAAIETRAPHSSASFLEMIFALTMTATAPHLHNKGDARALEWALYATQERSTGTGRVAVRVQESTRHPHPRFEGSVPVSRTYVPETGTPPPIPNELDL